MCERGGYGGWASRASGPEHVDVWGRVRGGRVRAVRRGGTRAPLGEDNAGAGGGSYPRTIPQYTPPSPSPSLGEITHRILNPQTNTFGTRPAPAPIFTPHFYPSIRPSLSMFHGLPLSITLPSSHAPHAPHIPRASAPLPQQVHRRQEGGRVCSVGVSGLVHVCI